MDEFTILSDMQNIGKVFALTLHTVGVETPSQLISVGSEAAIERLFTFDEPCACINMLYALEGAIEGVRWHKLPQSRKMELKAYFETLLVGS